MSFFNGIKSQALKRLKTLKLIKIMRELKILENAIKKNKSNRKIIRDRNNNRVYKKKT